jgi:PadR family transcriptional regulator PadR
MAAMAQTQWLQQVKRGVLELCILNLLQREQMYGYQLVKRLTSPRGLVTTAGTVYPLLSRLKRQGLVSSTLVESPAGPARRVYSLTTAGQRHLSRINDAWRQVADAVEAIMHGRDEPRESTE